MAAPTESERRLAAVIAAHESWAHTPNRSARTANARAAMLAKFETEVDPTGTLPPAERARRAEHLRKAYFARLALKSARSRRQSKEFATQADSAAAELATLGGDSVV